MGIIKQNLNISGIISASGFSKAVPIKFLNPILYIDDKIMELNKIENAGYYNNFLYSNNSNSFGKRTIKSWNELNQLIDNFYL